MRVLSIVAALSVSVVSASNAIAAATITFDEVEPNPCCAFAPSYVTRGMAFTSQAYSPGGLFFPPDINPFGYTNIDPGGASILGDPILLRVDGGGTFDLVGFTFGWRAEDDFGDTPATGEIDVRFVYDDGRDEVEKFEIHRFGPEALSITRLKLRKIEFQRGEIHFDMASCSFCTHTGGSIGPYAIDDVIIDNVAHSPDPDPALVPEPSTWALMIVGLGLAGSLLRRHYRCRSRPSRASHAGSMGGLRRG